MTGWHIWLLLNPERGTLGREVRFHDCKDADSVKAWVEARLPQFDVRVRNADTGAKFDRVKGQWVQSPVDVSPEPDAKPAAESRKPARVWWD